MPTAIEKEIFRTVAFFAYFGYPLTSFEVHKWQYRSSENRTLWQVMKALEDSAWLREHIDCFDGFYGIAGGVFGGVREQVRERHDRFKNAVAKYKKLRRYLPYLARLPGVCGIAVCNSLAMHHTREKSDIDLFVITHPGAVWSTRFFAVLPLMFLRQRPGEAKANPIDTSFFLSRDALNLYPYKLKEDDPYLAWWTSALMPVFDRGDVFTFFNRHNAWAQNKFPHAVTPRLAPSLRQHFASSFPRLFRMERLLGTLQRKKFPVDIRSAGGMEGGVVISNDILKFHKNDRRRTIKESFYEICAKANIKPFD